MVENLVAEDAEKDFGKQNITVKAVFFNHK